MFGHTGNWTTPFSLSTLNSSNGFKLIGNNPEDRSGYSVSTAGDINGDGISDIIMANTVGESYVIFGHIGNWTTPFSVASLDGSNGLKITGSGPLVNAAGDINGDGISDIVIGSPNANSNTGVSYVVFGHTGAWTTPFSLSALDGANGFQLIGENSNDYSGDTVSGGGDVNGDGVTDLFIGADSANAIKGACYIIFGHTGLWSTPLSLSNLTGNNGFKFTGMDPSGELSYGAFNTFLDVNGDGISDVLINEFGVDRAHILFGHTGTWTTPLNTSNTNYFTVFNGMVISVAGDVNADGITDIIFGSEAVNNNAGATYIVFGALAPSVQLINSLNIQEGETLLINGTYLNATYGNESPNKIQFSISSLEHGYFELVTQLGQAINTFTQLQINNHMVQFVHDGSCAQPGYRVAVSNGGLPSTSPSPSEVVFTSISPAIYSNSLSINQGQTVILTSSNLNITDPGDTSNNLRITISGLQHGQFTLVNAPNTSITQFTQAQINNQAVQFIHDGNTSAPTYSVVAKDSCGLTTLSQVANVNFNLPPVLLNNQLTIQEGQTVTLTSGSLSASDLDDPTDTLQFIVSNVRYGSFTSIQFSQRNVSDGVIKVTQNNCNSLSYLVRVVDPKGAASAQSNAVVTFISINPNIVTNGFDVLSGQTLVLSSKNLNVADPGDIPNNLAFTITNLKNGNFIPTQFTQQNINEGNVQFIPDGTNNAPSFDISVKNSCELVSATRAGNVTFTPSSNGGNTGSNGNGTSDDSTIRNSIVGGVVSGVVGLFFLGVKLYNTKKAEEHMSKETDDYRKKVIVPIAKEIAANVKITGFMGYISEDKNREYLDAVVALVRQMDQKGIAVSEIIGKDGLERISLLREIVRQTRWVLLGEDHCCSCRSCASIFCAEVTPRQIEDKADSIASAVKNKFSLLSPNPGVVGEQRPLVFSPAAASTSAPLATPTVETAVLKIPTQERYVFVPIVPKLDESKGQNEGNSTGTQRSQLEMAMK